MLKIPLSQLDNDSNLEKFFEICQFVPGQELHDKILKCCQQELEDFSGSVSEVINFFYATNEQCHCYILVIDPNRLLPENLSGCLFVPGGETEQQMKFFQTIAANFKIIWNELGQNSLLCQEHLLMGAILHGYLDKNTNKLKVFFEVRNVSNPPDELTADG